MARVAERLEFSETPRKQTVLHEAEGCRRETLNPKW